MMADKFIVFKSVEYAFGNYINGVFTADTFDFFIKCVKLFDFSVFADKYGLFSGKIYFFAACVSICYFAAPLLITIRPASLERITLPSAERSIENISSSGRQLISL